MFHSRFCYVYIYIYIYVCMSATRTAMGENGQTTQAGAVLAQAVNSRQQEHLEAEHRAKGSTDCGTSAPIRNYAWLLKQKKHVVPGYSAYARMAACNKMLIQRMSGVTGCCASKQISYYDWLLKQRMSGEPGYSTSGQISNYVWLLLLSWLRHEKG